MKITLIAISLFLSPLTLYADDIIKSFEASLMDHVVTSTMFGFTKHDSGPPRLLLVDSVIRIGRYENESLFDIQAGFFGNSNNVEDEADVANWIVGGQLRLDPFTRKYINLSPAYEFLNAVEHGLVGYYDFTNKHFIAGYSVGLSFDLFDK